MDNDKPAIKFYFDYISHNAYIAWTQIAGLAQKYSRQVEPIPVLFAGLLNAHNQLGPAEVKAKRNWMLGNTLRKAALLNIPLNPPASHPYNPLLSLRASLIEIESEKRFDLITRLFEAVWVDALDVSSRQVVADLFKKCGIDSESAIAECHSDKVKGKLRANTDAAIANGVFGVPSMRVDGELFWGYDDFPYMELVLKGADPIAANYRDPWLGLKPTAQRRKDIENPPR